MARERTEERILVLSGAAVRVDMVRSVGLGSDLLKILRRDDIVLEVGLGTLGGMSRDGIFGV